MGGPAHLRVRGGTAWFTITDTGPGIAADDLPHLFQPLYRGDRSRGAGTGGTGLGLGLAITHRVVTARDGTLVAGNTPTGGASFIATLPSSCPGQGTIGRRVDHPARGRALPTLSLWANK